MIQIGYQKYKKKKTNIFGCTKICLRCFEAKFIIILKDLIKILFYDLKFNKLIRKNTDSIYIFIDNLSFK